MICFYPVLNQVLVAHNVTVYHWLKTDKENSSHLWLDNLNIQHFWEVWDNLSTKKSIKTVVVSVTLCVLRKCGVLLEIVHYKVCAQGYRGRIKNFLKCRSSQKWNKCCVFTCKECHPSVKCRWKLDYQVNPTNFWVYWESFCLNRLKDILQLVSVYTWRIKKFLKVMSDIFFANLLICFFNSKREYFWGQKTCFLFHFKGSFCSWDIQILEILESWFSWRHEMPKHETSSTFYWILGSKHDIVIKFGQLR